jgi:proton-translocating NAD(P)+ transhydrogenase subunit alpha
MIDLAILISVFAGSLVVGYFLISRVPPLLHTPLMSMTNAISAVTILGGLLIFGEATMPIEAALGAVAIVMAVFNVIGGFAITDRMLRLFKKR